ncbi:MAG: NADH-quinone oxidoreductase subunit A [Isosphaeraceae bacterium]|nr:NADH-quinone oxidoreductase subunit A [Isosphaeraceae bacterium]
MGTEFTPIFLFILVGLLVALGMLITSALLGPKRKTPVKQMPYESGMDPIGDARQRFDVRYYLVAIVFLLFDVELLYLYPWAVAQWSADQPRALVPVAAAPDAATAPAPTIPTVPAAAIAVGIPPEFRTMIFWEIVVFILVLAAAFAYAWRKGVFEWR